MDPSSSGAGRHVRLLLVGPLPPPVHGQSVVMTHLISRLSPIFPQLAIANTCEGDSGVWMRPFVKLRRAAAAMARIRRADVVYIAVKAGKGMWLTTASASLARSAGAKVFLHHHSYAYVRDRKARMVALTRAAGPEAHHIVLSESMAHELRRVMPEIRRPLVLGNASLIDQTLLETPVKADSAALVLGHLSDLSMEKGIAEAIDLAVELNRMGTDVRLVVGGPPVSEEVGRHFERAAEELGDRFEYRGLLTGPAKHRFFSDITHFVFPSRYEHEAVPLVLYEALAAGAVCVATRQGSIPEQLADAPCVLAADAESLVAEALPVLAHATVSSVAAEECRAAYLRALSKSEKQLVELVHLFMGGAPGPAITAGAGEVQS